MKNIKKLKDLQFCELSKAKQKLIYGAFGTPCYDEETGIHYTVAWINGQEVCIDDGGYGGNFVGSSGGNSNPGGVGGSGGGNGMISCSEASSSCLITDGCSAFFGAGVFFGSRW